LSIIIILFFNLGAPNRGDWHEILTLENEDNGGAGVMELQSKGGVA